jgi:hypothetical protein
LLQPARLTLRVLAAATVLAASSAGSAASTAAAPVRAAHLVVSGGRSAAQVASRGDRKLDAALADLARHAPLARRAHLLSDLHAMSPAARFAAGPSGEALVAVDAITRGNPQQLRQVLVALGMQRVAVFGNDVGGMLPVTQLSAAASRDEVLSLRAALSRTRAAPVTSEGDFAQGSAALRAAHSSITGSGVTVGVLSDSFNCYAYYGTNGFPALGLQGYAQNGFTATATQDEADGALPTTVNVVQEADCGNYGAPLQLPFTDEGRAMLQIVHDVAPGAGLAFYTVSTTEAAFAEGIEALASAGAKVEVDDVGFFDEPFFQDGIVTTAIDNVTAQGVAYFTAAGNDSSLAYENTNPAFVTQSGEMLLNFDTSGASTTTSLPITIASLVPGEFVALVLEWDQPYATGNPGDPNNPDDPIASGTGATSEIDLCVTGSGGDSIYNFDGNQATCSGVNALGTDPVQILIIANPANSGTASSGSENLTVQIRLVSGTIPGRIKLMVADDGAGSSINEFQTNSPTIQGHSNAANAATVAAAFFEDTPRCGVTPATAEDFTSTGGDPVLFDSNGNPQTAVVRQKPDFTAPDGVNDTFLGWTTNVPNTSSVSECKVNTSYPSFFGTSAAAPHAAAVAALMLQYNSSLTPAQIFTFLRNTASAMGSATPNYQSGYGFIQADTAFSQVPAPPAGSSSSSSSSGTSSGSGGGGGVLDAATLAALALITALACLRSRVRRAR